mgnify:CR=1 FL=1
MQQSSTISIFLDDEQVPLAQCAAPVKLELDTRKLVDGPHSLRIVSKDPSGREGIRRIEFEVRNGPSITVEGVSEGAVVDGMIPLLINAYGKGDAKSFLIAGSETPRGIPSWVWILLIGFVAWAAYYLIQYASI